MATNQHTPIGRGYESSLIYYHHSNDYYTFKGTGNCGKTEMTDLWNKYGGVNESFPYGRPAKSYRNAASCSVTHQNPGGNATCIYEDDLFETRVHEVWVW